MHGDSAPGVDPPRSQPEAGSLLLKRFQLEKNNASQLKQILEVGFIRLAGIFP
jgi:hypothetical protein